MLVIKNVNLWHVCEQEEMNVRGNVCCIDPEYDRKQEDHILAELGYGNIWAWCRVVVKGQYIDNYGEEYTAWVSVGCCSYLDEEDFLNSDLYKDMREYVLDQLDDQVRQDECRRSAVEACQVLLEARDVKDNSDLIDFQALFEKAYNLAEKALES